MGSGFGGNVAASYVAFVLAVFALWVPLLHFVNEGEERELKVTLPCDVVNVTAIACAGVV